MRAGVMNRLPPIIIIPGVFSPQRCRDLIEMFERGDSRPGGVCRTVNGVAYNVENRSAKIRRDLKIPAAEIGDVLLNRCRREIVKAHNVRIAHMDRVIISRYDVGGFFAPHRDNSSPHVAFREIAVSVNLNAGDYEGGSLRFSEYGDAIHSPPTGGALIFSASVLHEVLPVISGSRYVLLTFFHSEAKDRIRVEALQKSARERRLCA